MYVWLDSTELAKKLPQHTQYIKYILEQGIAAATYQSYKSAFKQYVNWCISYDIQIWPITDIKWLYYSVERGIKLKYATVVNDFYSVAYFSRLHGQPLDIKLLKMSKQLRKDIRKVFKNDTPDKRLPITLELLEKKILPLYNLCDYDQLTFWALQIVAFFGFLRTSEFVAQNKNVNPSGTDEASIKALWINNLFPVYDDNETYCTSNYC